jgi:2-dehydro-3-deoxyphosphooctonate aldolase (KDO 8-P synthase)
MEIHENPEVAKSDGPNMVPLADLEDVLRQVLSVRTALEIAPSVNLK